MKMTWFVGKSSIAFVLAAALGLMVAPRLVADPSAAHPKTIGTAVPPPHPQTPQEQALQAHADSLQTQMAAAVTARRYDDYASALNQLASPDCRFFSVNGQSTSRTQFLDAERQSLTAQKPGLTESMRTLTLNITGQTALETAVATDDEDAVDTAGQNGSKGKKHHWQRQTFLRLHWAGASAAPAPRKRRGASDATTWQAQEIAVTDVQTFLDGAPYIPPQPKTKATGGAKQPKTNTSRTRTRTRQPRIRQPRTRRKPYVIPGVRVY